jgi:hypothetical protein
VDREPVLVGVLGHAPRQRPGDGDSLVLEPQVPVQVAGVVLLDDEAAGGRSGSIAGLVAGGLRCAAGRAL